MNNVFYFTEKPLAADQIVSEVMAKWVSIFNKPKFGLKYSKKIILSGMILNCDLPFLIIDYQIP